MRWRLWRVSFSDSSCPSSVTLGHNHRPTTIMVPCYAGWSTAGNHGGSQADDPRQRRWASHEVSRHRCSRLPELRTSPPPVRACQGHSSPPRRIAHSSHMALRRGRKRWEALGTSAQVTGRFVGLSTGRQGPSAQRDFVGSNPTPSAATGVSGPGLTRVTTPRVSPVGALGPDGSVRRPGCRTSCSPRRAPPE
jgi:hypothetical protein